jgi:predicted dehydrogenase
MSIKKVRVLVVGCGNRGEAYTRALRHAKEYIEVCGLVEPNRVRREKLKKKCGEYFEIIEDAVREYDDWPAALEDTDCYDAVIVTVLDAMHREVAVAFADRGKHLLCEKPLATNWDDCQVIYEAVKRNNVLLAIGHVLRYSPHNIQLKEMLDRGVIGDIINVNHTEPVGWYHFAHSFVRGNWRREDETTFALMAKSCHDLDLLLWFMGPENLTRVSSFGSLAYFKAENKPTEANGATRCVECPLKDTCGYSAKKIYYDDFVTGKSDWKIDTLTDIEDEPHVLSALREGPYGRCVFEADNDVCDNQVVSLEFGGKTATMTMIAFSREVCERKIQIYGTKGEINTDSNTIRLFDFGTQETTYITPEVDAESHHGGGDRGLALAFAEAVRDVLINGNSVTNAQAKYIRCTPEDTLASHRSVFLAEQARRAGTVVSANDIITL